MVNSVGLPRTRIHDNALLSAGLDPTKVHELAPAQLERLASALQERGEHLSGLALEVSLPHDVHVFPNAKAAAAHTVEVLEAGKLAMEGRRAGWASLLGGLWSRPLDGLQGGMDKVDQAARAWNAAGRPDPASTQRLGVPELDAFKRSMEALAEHLAKPGLTDAYVKATPAERKELDAALDQTQKTLRGMSGVHAVGRQFSGVVDAVDAFNRFAGDLGQPERILRLHETPVDRVDLAFGLEGVLNRYRIS